MNVMPPNIFRSATRRVCASAALTLSVKGLLEVMEWLPDVGRRRRLTDRV